MVELYLKHVKVKRLANKTTHRCGSSGKEKQPSESIWSAKKMVAMEWNNQGSSSKILADKRKSRDVNGFIFTQAWTMKNFAWIRFHFYTSLKRKTMLVKKKNCCMPPAWLYQSRYMPPKLPGIHGVDGMKVYLERLDWRMPPGFSHAPGWAAVIRMTGWVLGHFLWK